MNKNIKKVATVILATNVLASTVLTTLPIGTHASETPVTLAGPFVDTIDITSTHITGKADPNATSIKVELHNEYTTLYKTIEYTSISADGSFSISTSGFDLPPAGSVFISQVVNGVESSVTKTPVRYPQLQIGDEAVTTSTKSIVVSNALAYSSIRVYIYDASGKYISSIAKTPMTNGPVEFKLDLSNYAPGSYMVINQGYAGSLPEYLSSSIPTKAIIYDGSLDKSKSLVDALFIDNDPAKGIKPTTTQADIDAVQVALDLVVDTIDKSTVQTAIDNAKQELADQATNLELKQAAQKAVDALFVDGDASKDIKSDLTQATIDAAQAKVDAITNTTDKAAIQAELDKAITAFNYIAPTTIDALSNNATKVTGKGEANAPVVIKNGATVIGSGTVKANGTYEITIAKQAAEATITATVTKASNGKTATASTKVTQAFDYALTTNPFKMGDTKVTGTVGKNVSKVRLWVNGAIAVQGVINADGTYEFPTAANFIKLVGDKVEVVAVDSNYAEVNRQDVAVSGTSTFDNTLTVDKLNVGDQNITGKAGKDVSKVRLWVNDKVVTQASMNTDGTYTFPNAAKFITSPLDKVEVVAVDSQYKEINRKTVSVPGSDSYGNTFTADTYFIGQNTLNGSYGEGTSKVRLWVNGVVVKQADLDTANGTYTLKGIFGLIKNATDKVEIVFVDAQYKEIKRMNVTVK
ncbi:immunoglobulin-like domain-containing protein [Listeria rustica]|uniref:Bacterial Ig domain-containing protein n=1 Tax=Listeria rustica TaxID=2713503 RepID=A0A7W1T874_9LIST|nr:immunoglobulin-like domain-containing protein [Listeria rustica]MBA3927277.1 hypothetical protein [Listeria rustica]